MYVGLVTAIGAVNSYDEIWTELPWAVCWQVPVSIVEQVRRLRCNRVEMVSHRWEAALVTDATLFPKLLAPSVCGGGEEPQRFGCTGNKLRVQMLACFIVNNNCMFYLCIVTGGTVTSVMPASWQ